MLSTGIFHHYGERQLVQRFATIYRQRQLMVWFSIMERAILASYKLLVSACGRRNIIYYVRKLIKRNVTNPFHSVSKFDAQC